jgi:hypothetical protein
MDEDNGACRNEDDQLSPPVIFTVLTCSETLKLQRSLIRQN